MTLFPSSTFLMQWILLFFLLTPITMPTHAKDKVEWPIDLTCEIGTFVIQWHLTGEPKTSWYRPISGRGGLLGFYVKKKDFGKKNFFIKRIFVEKDSIWFTHKTRLSGGLGTQINRHSLGVNTQGPDMFGQCHLGLKEFKKRF